MNVLKSIMKGLTEATDYQQGKIHARKTKLTINAKPGSKNPPNTEVKTCQMRK